LGLKASVGLRVLRMVSLKRGSVGVEIIWLLDIAALRDTYM
jgi:hypothetical protein